MFVGGIASFILGFVLFARFFPLISLWEIEEGRKESVHVTSERLRGYLPDPLPAAASRSTVEGGRT